MHIALYNKSEHKVEYIEEHDDHDLYLFHQRLVAEAQMRGPDWTTFYDERPFDWDIVDHQPTDEEKSAARMAEILGEISTLEASGIRPARAIALGISTDDDVAKLDDIESAIVAMRAEYAKLKAGK